MLTTDYDYIDSSYKEEAYAAAAVNVSVTMMSRRAGMLAWMPRDAFAGKKVEVVFAPKGSRQVHSIEMRRAVQMLGYSEIILLMKEG